MMTLRLEAFGELPATDLINSERECQDRTDGLVSISGCCLRIS